MRTANKYRPNRLNWNKTFHVCFEDGKVAKERKGVAAASASGYANDACSNPSRPENPQCRSALNSAGRQKLPAEDNLTANREQTVHGMEFLDTCMHDQLLLGFGIGKHLAPVAPLGGENPKNFYKLVRTLIEYTKYKNAIEQSVGSSPCKPLWLIVWTILAGTRGSFAMALPSKREFKRPKTTKRTRAMTTLDLNLKRERSRLVLEVGLDVIDLLGLGLLEVELGRVRVSFHGLELL
ncbi:hypothetical protein HYC85_029431 [Camellia sinensis]|uniref:Uncharacterized protein n=1 Tax=Camellia sinensis TaxID=4442 RepID=A0A7J7FXZ3_CAMSI|nr:hypothetical protein HYC85_029431 [Camellia sinensis]